MSSSPEKAEITDEERTLKEVGQAKFEISQNLTAGRDFLDSVAGRDTTARNAEKLRAQHAVELGRIDLEDSAKIDLVDSRTAARAGVAARATSEEDSFSATKAILNADLGVSSSVDSSLRSSAQSKTALQESLLRESTNKANNRLEIAGSIAGGIGTAAANGAFSDVDVLANSKQTKPNLETAILSNPNRQNGVGIYDPFASRRNPQLLVT